MSVAVITFSYDLGSPYAWLAAERVEELAGGEVRWAPVLLGAVFRARGWGSWADTEERAAGMAEVERRARERGLPPVRWPDPWPNAGLLAMRVAVAADSPAFARAAFRVHFVDGRPLSEEANVALAVERAGLDPGTLLAAARTQPVKDALRAGTDAALAAGVMGVPSIRVGDRVTWGDDRLEEALAGR